MGGPESDSIREDVWKENKSPSTLSCEMEGEVNNDTMSTHFRKWGIKEVISWVNTLTWSSQQLSFSLGQWSITIFLQQAGRASTSL